MKNLLCLIFVIGHASFISNNIILDQNSTQTIFNSADDIFTYTNYFSNLYSNSSIYFSFETTSYEITNSIFSIYAIYYMIFLKFKENSAQKNLENEEKQNLLLNFSKFVISSNKSHLSLRNLNIKIKGLDNYVFYLQNYGTLTFLVKKKKKKSLEIMENYFRNVPFF